MSARWRATPEGFVHRDADCNDKDCHYVVVIDPEDDGDVDRVADAIRDHGSVVLGREVDWLGIQAALRDLAAPTLPKPDEPQGLGAVVEDDRGIRFVRTYSVEHDTAWVTGNHRRPWSEVDAVRVLSEGVTS